MNYREFQPSPALRGTVECLWTLSSDGKSKSAVAERIVPDGCVELVLNFGDLFTRRRPHQASEYQPRSLVVGQMDTCVQIQPTGAVDLLGVRFHPAGAFPFFHIPLNEFTGLALDLATISKQFEGEIATRLCGLKSTGERIAAIERILLARRNDAPGPEAAVVQSVRAMLATYGLVRIAALESRFGMSSRQLERKFHRFVGVSPKLLCRIFRFQTVFKAQEQGSPSTWALVALACGYYDQAHLVHEFKQFAGTTPATLFSEEAALTFRFTRKNRVSNFYNTPH